MLLIFKTHSQEGYRLGETNTKIVGVIDKEKILSQAQQSHIDSTLWLFHKRTSIRIVVIVADTSVKRNLFFKVRNEWGYTDNDVSEDICIVTSTKPKSIGFWDDLADKLFTEDERDKLIRTYWWPDTKAGKYYDGLVKFIDKLTLAIIVRLNQIRG